MDTKGRAHTAVCHVQLIQALQLQFASVQVLEVTALPKREMLRGMAAVCQARLQGVECSSQRYPAALAQERLAQQLHVFYESLVNDMSLSPGLVIITHPLSCMFANKDGR